jgi:lambda repressor-like predicted transcriptional regulator
MASWLKTNGVIMSSESINVGVASSWLAGGWRRSWLA